MTMKARHAVITGGSRGIGKGIALKLAEQGVKIAVNYVRDEVAATSTLAQIRERGSDGFICQADVSRPADVARLFGRVKKEFGSLDIFVSNAPGEVSTFYEPTMSISLDKWDATMDSQAKAFLVVARAAAELMGAGGRIVAITFAPGVRFGSWQSWVAMGAAKSALEVLSRYFAGRAGPTRDHRQRDQSGVDRGYRPQNAARARRADDPRLAQGGLDADGPSMRRSTRTGDVARSDWTFLT